ncbi:MAG: NAD(P)/FAD-dependent oxidoreductase [Steroidobacteraceae bacterium]
MAQPSADLQDQVMLESIVIVGAGQAAMQAAYTLRRKGFPGTITLVGEEPWLPYQRPPLSKKYLAGTLEREQLLLRPALFYATHGLKILLGRRVEEIVRREQRVRLDDGTTLPYDSLLIAAGCRPRPLAVPGAQLQGVHYLRNIADVEGIRAALFPGCRLVIVGGGYIGLELAATARARSVEVTVLEWAERVLNRVVCESVSVFYQAEHLNHGVRILCNAKVHALEGGAGKVIAVLTQDGMSHPADVVVAGIGVLPADELASAAGLKCDNGVVVDEHCRTSDPRIFAAGDCANHPSAHYGRRLRLESVDNAIEQATSAALNMLGIDTVHDKVPWFWSDQYDLKLIIVGISQGHDTVVLRGDPASRAFSACYLRDGELLAIDTINRAQDHIAARKLIAARAHPDPGKLADIGVPLREAARAW